MTYNLRLQSIIVVKSGQDVEADSHITPTVKYRENKCMHAKFSGLQFRTSNQAMVPPPYRLDIFISIREIKALPTDVPITNPSWRVS